jgi:hypothetical protein
LEVGRAWSWCKSDKWVMCVLFLGEWVMDFLVTFFFFFSWLVFCCHVLLRFRKIECHLSAILVFFPLQIVKTSLKNWPPGHTGKDAIRNPETLMLLEESTKGGTAETEEEENEGEIIYSFTLLVLSFVCSAHCKVQVLQLYRICLHEGFVDISCRDPNFFWSDALFSQVFFVYVSSLGE